MKQKKYMYDFQQLEMKRSFGDYIYTGKISIDEAEMDQSNLLENMVEFNDKSRSSSELTFTAIKTTKREGLKILTAKNCCRD